MIGYLAVAFLLGIIAGEVIMLAADWRERRKMAERHGRLMRQYR